MPRTYDINRRFELPANTVLALLTIFAFAASACSNENTADISSKAEAPETTQAVPQKSAKPKRQAIKVARVIGQITAMVNGSRSKWYITHQYRDGGDASASEWRERTATTTAVTLVGHKTPTTTVVSGSGEIMLDFVISNINTDRAVSEVRIDYFPMGLAKAYSSEAGGMASVVLHNATLKNGALKLEGTFSGTLPFISKTGEKAPGGLSQFQIEDGVFSASVRKE